MSDNLTPYRPKTAFGSPGGTAQTQGIDLGAGALGAGNAVLFGLPEAALKALGGEKQKQIIEAYKAAHPEYGVGETLGNVGSMFIPGGQIAKLASLGGKIAPLAKLGEVAAGAPSITQGLAAAAEQAVPRAFGSQQEGKDVGQRALEAGGQIGLGGALGGVLEGAGKLGKAIKEKYSVPSAGKELRENANETIVHNVVGVKRKDIAPLVKGMSYGQADEKVDDLFDKAAEIINDGPVRIRNIPTAEAIVGEEGVLWKPFQEVYDKSPQPLGNQTISLMQSPYVKKILGKYGMTKGQDALLEVAIRADNDFANVGANAGTKSAWGVHRASLNEMIGAGFKDVPEGPIAIRGEMANAVKQAMDETTAKMANPKDIADAYKAVLPPATYNRLEDGGFDGQEVLKEIKARWPAIKMMQTALLRDKMSGGAFSTTGSDTAARQILNAPNPLTAMFNAAGGQVLNRVLSDASNMASTGVATALRNKMTPEGIANANKVAQGLLNPQLPPNLAQLLGNVGKSATERAGLLPQIVGAGNQQATLTPDQNQQVPAIDRLPAPNFGQTQVQPVTQVQPAQPTPQDILEEKIAQNWDLLTDPNGLIEKGQPGVRQQFIDKVKSQLIDDQGNINYLRAAKALFPGDSASAKSFLDSYQRFATIQKGLPDAVKLQTFGDAQATANKQAVIDATIDTLKKGGMDSKKAEEVVTGLLNNPLDDPGKKSAKLLNLLRTYDQIGFGKGGVLERAGVLR